MNKEGTTLASTDENFIGENYGFRDYFKKASKGESSMDVSLGVTSKQLGYYFSTPVINDDKDIIGVAVIKMKPSVIDDAIGTETEISGIMLVDKFGIIVSSSKAERLYKSLGALNEEEIKEIEELKRYQNIEITSFDYEIVQNNLASVDDSKLFELYDEIDRTEEILSLAKIQDFPFYVLLEEHEAKYINSAKKIAYILSTFPALTETFIVREIQALLNRNFEVSIFAVKKPDNLEFDRSLCNSDIFSRTSRHFLWHLKPHNLFQ